MTVAQTGKTTNSVTIEVRGMEYEYDRQTSVWIPKQILGDDNGEWYSLAAARSAGYISDYIVEDIEENNGWITVNIPERYAGFYKVWQFRVLKLIKDTDNVAEEFHIFAVLGFDYKGESVKEPGMPIDIEADDMLQIGYFGFWVSLWITGIPEEEAYWYNDYASGDEIAANYLSEPAGMLADAAGLIGSWGMVVQSYTSDIIANCRWRAAFKASYFNDIQTAINNFMPSGFEVSG